MKKTKIKKILVVRLHAIGDLVITTVFFNMMKKNFPAYKIDLLCYEYVRGLSRHIANIDRFVFINNKTFKFLNPFNWYYLIKFFLICFKIDCDIIISFHPNIYINYILKLIFIYIRKKEVLIPGEGYLKDIVDPSFSHYKRGLNHYKDVMPQFFNSLIVKLNYKPIANNVSFENPSLIVYKNDLENCIKKYNLPQNSFIAIFPGGGSNIGEKTSSRRYPYMDVVIIDAFKEDLNKPKLVLLGSKDDLILCNKLLFNLSLNGFNVTNLCCKTNISEYISILFLSSFVITNDSSALHISSALKKPFIVFFGPTDYREMLYISNKNSYVFYSNKDPVYFGKLKDKNIQKEHFFDAIDKKEVSNKIRFLYLNLSFKN